jgi:oxygen-independent coproporphyrinogen-3 oxidase
VASFSHVGGVHFQNVAGWGGYLERLGRGELPIERALAPTPHERMTRELILQMKLGRVDLDYFRRKFDTDVAQEFAPALAALEERGMLRVIASREIRLTRQGLLRVDALLPSFYDARYQGTRYT